ncbi:hypothetical protein [Streptomyces lavendulae]|uniref:hypothetical protein n=1 Tax=Streptomyces lavendulae TaxID=1914 RepID=UPI003677A888
MAVATSSGQLSDVLVSSVEVSDAVVTARARTRSGEPAGCTGWGQLSLWCHGRYARGLADVTLAGQPLRVELSVRRLFYENTTRPKVTFAVAALPQIEELLLLPSVPFVSMCSNLARTRPITLFIQGGT